MNAKKTYHLIIERRQQEKVPSEILKSPFVPQKTHK